MLSRRILATTQPCTRSYAVSVEQSRMYEGKAVPRRYSERKAYLYNQYTNMLGASSQAPIILLQHKDFDTRRLQLLRKEIEAANAKFTPSLTSPTPATPPKLTVMRTSIFGVALRDFAPLDTHATENLAKLVEGGLAMLSLPSLNPPQLNAIIRAMDRAVPAKKAVQEDASKGKGRRDEDADFIPGRPRPRVKPQLTPELKVMGALIEGRVFSATGVKDVAKLPTLDTLRAQIVGLLSSPAMQLAAILSEASGGKLARTLEGLKNGLEESQASPS
ncbi:hypothetical protein SCLCIDRAFT_1207393 [Scleroderma citrinum Foug A]|uniref:Ribosomal protein L10 n=1 Tax=Scleroderma citrinum Foug A TaxID=1036808 RepID=A0A0C3AYP8_9AGAM|nr:hypothetical protein SCLCIDRAFT_1207393 [Scleroderma citrinum Foug A]